jgi:proline racemase
MYGGFLVPADDGDAHLGVLFWHKDGFSTACGHGAIALGVWAVDTGRVPGPRRRQRGRGHRRALGAGHRPGVHRTRGRTVAVDFVNVPSYVLARDVPLATSRGEVAVTVAYGGAIYASIDATTVGLSVDPLHYQELIALGREVKWALNATEHAAHPTDPRLSGVYGTILHEDLGGHDGQVRQRNVTVFADGEVDRSPCGSGTCARLAVLADQGRVTLGGPTLDHKSIVGSRFTGTVVATTTAADRPAVVPQVTGLAHRTGAAGGDCVSCPQPAAPITATTLPRQWRATRDQC